MLRILKIFCLLDKHKYYLFKSDVNSITYKCKRCGSILIEKKEVPMTDTIKKFTLIRTNYDDKGTLGLLYFNNKLFCYTLELPWEDNRPNISCVPKGTYKCIPWQSPKFGFTYEVLGVPNRSKILIHKGNWVTDIEGCVLVGMQQSLLDGNNDRYSVFNSKDAFNSFIKLVKGDVSFNLEIKDI